MTVLLRFLATGDLQAHNWRQFAVTLKDGMNSRLKNILRVFHVLRREAKERGIGKILINGDVFEEVDYIPVEVYDAVYRELDRTHEAGLDTVINIGNHDISLQTAERTIHTLRPFRKVARIVESPALLWKHLWAIPFMSDAEELKEAIRKVRPEHPSVLALHVGVQGATVGPKDYLIRCPVKLRDVRPKDFDLVLLSDFHKAQRLRSNVFYLGSPLQHTFGENHRPRVWDVSLTSGDPYFRLSKIYTDFPRFRRITIRKLQDLKEQASSLSGNYIRCIVRGSGVLDEELEQFAKQHKFLLQIERGERGNEGERVSVRTLNAHEVISRYARSHAKGSRVERLISLGTQLYGG